MIKLMTTATEPLRVQVDDAKIVLVSKTRQQAMAIWDDNGTMRMSKIAADGDVDAVFSYIFEVDNSDGYSEYNDIDYLAGAETS